MSLSMSSVPYRLSIRGLRATHGMREEDSPAVANVVVELDRAVRGVGLEVGGNRAETEARNKIISQFRGLERYT